MIDLTNQRFGRLVVIKELPPFRDKANRKYRYWECKCDCGNTTKATTQNLKGNHVKSCGCYQKETAGQHTRKHGYRKTRLYSIYNGMKQRCNNPNHREYSSYGGRGICVFDEWNKKDGLKAFAEWALNNGYKDNLTLERVDVDGNYEPSNCTWIPKPKQNANTTRTVLINYNGETLHMAEFCRRNNLDHRVVSRALKKGKTIEEIIRKECQIDNT